MRPTGQDEEIGAVAATVRTRASSDHAPAPTMSRKRLPHSMATSVRDSWMKSHHPDFPLNSAASPHRMGSLVISSAPTMFTIIGTTAIRVSRPGQNQDTATDFEHGVHGCDEFGGGDAGLVEAAGAQPVGIEEFLYALAHEDHAEVEADQYHRRGRGRRGRSGGP